MIHTLSKEAVLRVLQPGLVHMERALTKESQIALTHLCLGEHLLQRGEYTTETRKRFYGSLDPFPGVAKPCLDFLSHCQRSIFGFPISHPSHFILNQYITCEGVFPHIKWHQDNGENDGQSFDPVVSISMGDACDFLICNTKPRISSSLDQPTNLSYRIRLLSGDALVWWGPSRFVWHSIYKMFPHTSPVELPLTDSRINLTYRVTPHLTGKETAFEKIPDNLSKSNRFYQLSQTRI